MEMFRATVDMINSAACVGLCFAVDWADDALRQRFTEGWARTTKDEAYSEGDEAGD